MTLEFWRSHEIAYAVKMCLGWRPGMFSQALLVIAEFTPGNAACHQLAVYWPLKHIVLNTDMIPPFWKLWRQQQCICKWVKARERNLCRALSTLQYIINFRLLNKDNCTAIEHPSRKSLGPCSLDTMLWKDLYGRVWMQSKHIKVSRLNICTYSAFWLE